MSSLQPAGVTFSNDEDENEEKLSPGALHDILNLKFSQRINNLFVSSLYGACSDDFSNVYEDGD